MGRGRRLKMGPCSGSGGARPHSRLARQLVGSTIFRLHTPMSGQSISTFFTRFILALLTYIVFFGVVSTVVLGKTGVMGGSAIASGPDYFMKFIEDMGGDNLSRSVREGIQNSSIDRSKTVANIRFAINDISNNLAIFESDAAEAKKLENEANIVKKKGEEDIQKALKAMGKSNRIEDEQLSSLEFTDTSSRPIDGMNKPSRVSDDIQDKIT